MKFYGDIHGLKVVNLRLSNIYGERSQMQHAKFGVVNWFIRQAMDGETIKVFGGGNIMRDFLYIDDCVEAIILAGFTEAAHGGTFNVGNSTHATILELVDTILAVVKRGKKENAPFSKERADQEPGDFYPDISRMEKVTGWRPRTGLKEGLAKTAAYYKKHQAIYW